MTLKLLLADDHAMLRDALKEVLSDLDQDTQIIEADSYSTVSEAIGRHESLDLLLLDLRMPGMEGAKSVENIATRVNAPIVVFSGQFERQDVFDCLAAGAAGFIPKAANTDILINAVQLVLAGDIYIPSSVIIDGQGAITNPSTDQKADELPDTLTKREREILGQLVLGKPNKEIASEFGLQLNTVKVHLHNLYRKLGATNRTDAVRIALGAK